MEIVDPPPKKEKKDQNPEDNEPVDVSEKKPVNGLYDLSKLPKKPAPPNLQDEVCPICFEKPINNPVGSQKCKHVYCYECIYNWLSRYKKLCPVCKQKLLKSDLVSYIDTNA